MINNKPFLEHPVKSKQEAHKKLIEMSRNDDYTAGNLLDYLCHQNYYQVIGIDLSRQTNTNIPQQINFVEKLEEDDDVLMFFIAEKHQRTILNVSLNSLKILTGKKHHKIKSQRLWKIQIWTFGLLVHHVNSF